MARALLRASQYKKKMAAEKTAYELEREARIEANKRKIAVSRGTTMRGPGPPWARERVRGGHM